MLLRKTYLKKLAKEKGIIITQEMLDKIEDEMVLIILRKIDRALGNGRKYLLERDL